MKKNNDKVFGLKYLKRMENKTNFVGTGSTTDVQIEKTHNVGSISGGIDIICA